MDTMTYSTGQQISPWMAFLTFLAIGLALAVLAMLSALPAGRIQQASCCSEQLLDIDSEKSTHLARLKWEYFLLQDLTPETRDISPANPAETVRPLTAGEAHSLETHMSHRLPRYQDLFQTVAGEHAIDWHLVAAISYQESHWHPKAKSPTGVRGMMMLTLPTAKELGIRNRLDAEQSVRGGVRYLLQLKRRLPESIQEPDRTWQALAAYNVGIGHLYDARILARNHGLNPDNWKDVRDCLLRLEDPSWHKQVRYGYARGSEPVQYVDNIQRYYRYLLSAQTDAARRVVASRSKNRNQIL